MRRGCFAEGAGCLGDNENKSNSNKYICTSKLIALYYRLSFIIENNTIGKEAVTRFAKNYMLFFFYKNLHRLANIIRRVPDFLRLSIEFRHVLDIS